MKNSTDMGFLPMLSYDPFGMIIVGRDFGANYRFGFNGYENTDELLGDNTAIDFGARIYDCRIARFFSIDPRSSEYPWQSVYVYFSNCPIAVVDVNGMGGPNKDGHNDQSNELNDSQQISAVNNNNSSVGLNMEHIERYLYLNNMPSSTSVSITTFTTYNFVPNYDGYKFTPIKLSDGAAFLEGLSTGLGDQYVAFRSFFTWTGFKSQMSSLSGSLMVSVASGDGVTTMTSIYTTILAIKSIPLSTYERDDYFYGGGYIGSYIFTAFLGSEVSSFSLSAAKNVNPFGLRGGYGVFGENGLKLGGYRMDLMYATPTAGEGAGTIFSLKQLKPEGALWRWDYGKLHKTGNLGLHSTVRFYWNGVKYGSTAQRTWYPTTFKAPFFKVIE